MRDPARPSRREWAGFHREPGRESIRCVSAGQGLFTVLFEERDRVMLTRYYGLLSSEDLSTLDDFVAGFRQRRYRFGDIDLTVSASRGCFVLPIATHPLPSAAGPPDRAERRFPDNNGPKAATRAKRRSHPAATCRSR